MPQEIKWELFGQRDGAMRAVVTGVTKSPKNLLRNQREYCERFLEDLDRYSFSRLDVVVNCVGGYVISAMGLMMALEFRAKRYPIRILIDNQCSSAAVLLLGTSVPVYIVPTGRILVHKARTEVYAGRGTKWRLKNVTAGTDRTNTKISQALRIRAKRNHIPLPRGRVQGWMETEKIFTAYEAVKMGLADGIVTRAVFDRG